VVPGVLHGPVVLRGPVTVPVALKQAAGLGYGRRRGDDPAERECGRSSGEQRAFDA
jgi:hypothetical protein